MNKSIQCIKSCSVALVVAGLAAASTVANADKILADHFPHIQSVPTANMPSLGAIPTFWVNLDPVTMAGLLRRDREEGRVHFDKTNPSLLDPYLVKLVNSPVGSASANGFSQGNPHICFTVISASIPAWNDKAITPSSYNAPLNASRTCAASYDPVPLSRNNYSALTQLYAAYGVKVAADYTSTKVSILKFNPDPTETQGATQPSTEGWGTAFYDDVGLTGRLQEIVWTTATYIEN